MATRALGGRRYRVIESLGRGAWGQVYLAEDALEPGRLVAIKTRRVDPRGTSLGPAGLAREFRALTRVRHPNVARVFDLGLARDSATGAAQLYFTRELVDGVDLVSALAGADAESVGAAAATLCHAVATIHAHGVVHADLSPGNVLVPPGDPSGLKVIDFGLATVADPAEGSAASGLQGTLHYMAPEVLRGGGVSASSDLYALGALLYHAIAGEPPFRGAAAAVIQQHLDVLPAPLEGRRPDLPASLPAVVHRLLAKDSSRRYGSAWDALRDLEGVEPDRRRPVGEAPLIGRDAELATLERLLRPGAGPSVMLLVGERGSGRTRLLEALRWRLQLGGGPEVLELGLSGPERDPLAPARALLARLRLVGSRPPPEGWPVEAVLGGSSEAGALAGAFEALATYGVEALASAPAVLLVDDLDLAPQPARELLRHLARALDEGSSAPPLLLASRPGRVVDELEEELDRVERITLGELDAADVDRLVAALAGGPRPELAGRVRSHAGGLPGYVEEVTRALIERGEVAAEGDGLPVPTGLEAALRERVSRLGPRERVFLDVAAVLDRPISWADLRDEPRGLDERSFLEVGRGLAAAGLLAEVGAAVFAFERTAVRDAVYGACPPRMRRRLHAAQARALVPPGGPRPEGEALVEAAWHAVMGRPSDEAAAAEAAELALAAAAHLRCRGDARAAVELLRPALRVGRGGRLCQLRMALADALATGGAYDEATDLLEVAASEAVGPERGELLTAAGRLLERKGDYEESAVHLGRALDCELAPDARAEALEGLARVHLARGARDAAAAAVAEALATSPAAELAARLLCTSGLLQSYGGDHDAALETLGRALSLARRAKDSAAEAMALGHLAIARGRAGRLADSAAAYRQAAELAERSGDLGRLPAHLMNLGTACHALGDLGEALELYRRAGRLARRMGKSSVVVAALANLADLFAYLGAAEEARETASRAHHLARRAGMAAFEARALQALAEAAACQSPAAGLRDAERAAALFDELGLAERAFEARLVAAELVLWAGDPARAHELAGAAAEAAVDVAEPGLAARAELVAAEAQVVRGEGAAARAVLERLAGADEAVSDEVRWRALAALGTAHAQAGDPARAESCDRAAAQFLEDLTSRVPPEHRDALGRHPARRALMRRARTRTAPGLKEERVYRLMEVNRAVLAERDPRRLLALALDTSVELCGAERGFLITTSPKGVVRVEVARNLDREAVRGARLKVSRSIAEEVARSGTPLLTVDAQQDERFTRFSSVKDLRLRSVMCVPIRGRDSILGTLYLDNRFQSARFGQEDLSLLLAFADVVAVALENARLIEENARKAEELERAKAELEVSSREQARRLESALRELETTREALGLKYDYSQIIGRSPGMLRVFQVLDRIIDAHVPVLIHGESGTGKELIARAIHFNGPRRDRPFVSVNCGAIPETLLESELFGHVRGAFTGATATRQGLIAAADGGTLLLDEIGDMSPAMQTKLLRAVQEGEVRPVGSTEDLKVDVRIVAASHRNLSEEVSRGTFREDLYYRIAVVQIRVPPLRDRREDLPALAEHMLERFAGEIGGRVRRLSPSAVDRLLAHDWPGNVRELENVLKSAAVFASGDLIAPEDIHLPERSVQAQAVNDTLNLAELERQAIARALAIAGGNKKRAAELLGIARLTLYRKLKGSRGAAED